MTARRRPSPADPRYDPLVDARAWDILSWAGVTAFAGALVALLLLGHWQELRIAFCFFAPLLVVMVTPHGLPGLLRAAIVACFLVSGAGWAWDWYARHWWFDVVLHALNPLVMMAGSMVMLWKADFLGHPPRPGPFVLWGTALGLALGVVWEVFEFTYLPLTWPDTILDVVMDTAGSALGGWAALWIIGRSGRAPVGRRHAGVGTTPGWQAQRIPLPVRVPDRRR